MMEISLLKPVDYLIIGNLSVDVTHKGKKLGGTAAYAALTAHALGLRVGLVTSWGAEIPLSDLKDIPVAGFPVDHSTSFENRYIDNRRIQHILYQAPPLDYYQIPEIWRNSSIVHLGPIAQEVEPGIVRNFPSALIGVTPQGWMRGWDENGRVYPVEWPESAFVLERVGAAVISVDDVDRDENRIDEMAAHCRVLAVTESLQGARLYWHGDVRRFRPPEIEEVDSTGAGDIFAAAFFTRLFTTRDPWEAARFATQLSAFSVTRPGLQGIPTQEEINACLVEVF
jgi:sugar/nucleoside kinase (ribokinase family)